MQVEIWSDIACPWCYVGKRRFEAALENFEHKDEVNVIWRSFELDPAAPAEREHSIAEHLSSKYGVPLEQAKQMNAQMTQTAKGEGLDFDFSIQRGGNTFDAHRLVHLADTHGKQDAMKERLLKAYFTEGALVSDHETLKRLANDVDLPEEEVDNLLSSDIYADAVRQDQAIGRGFGISGVPFFVVDRKFGASGAQPPAVLHDLLNQAYDARPAVSLVAEGDSCGPDGC